MIDRDHDEADKMPSGWWIAPALIAGVVFWAGVYALIF